MILGLVNSESYENYRLKDFKQSIQYQYPNGKFPLAGLLSLMTPEETVDPEFYHWERRVKQRKTLTASMGSSKGPIKNSSDADPGDPVSVVAGTAYTLCVDDATQFRVGELVMMKLLNTSDAEVRPQFRITALADTSGTPNKLTAVCVNSVANLYNGATNENVDKEVIVVGSAFHEGRSAVDGEVCELPTKITNYTQIFRTPFSFTRTALKNPQYFDKTGPYKTKAKDAMIQHMINLEMAYIFGRKSEVAPSGTVDTATGTGLPIRYTGGLIYHLERWEAGDYGTVTATSDSDIDKRIIENTAGTLDEDSYDDYLARLASKGNEKSPEWLCMCGWGFASTINKLFKGKSVLNTSIPSREAYGMKVVEHLTPFGTIYYKTHPLFSDNDEWRYWGLFVDVHSLKYRPLSDSDTTLKKMIQANDLDGRKDEWLTEAGLQVQFPERFMLIKNATTPVF